MDGFAVRQQDNAKVPIVHLWHLAPAPNRQINGALNPHVLNQRPIRTPPDRLEVEREFHITKVTERRGGAGAA